MAIYLPIAEVSVSLLTLVAIGAAVGFLSGLFGVGGGFLVTPLLIFYGIPPAVAVATGANQVVGSSVSGTLAHLKRGAVDVRLGLVLLAGGIAGSSVGVWAYTRLLSLGQLDLVVSILYVALLGTVGGLMLAESLRAIRRAGSGPPVPLRRSGSHSRLHGLPFKMRFKTSRLYVSILPILGLGGLIGMLAAVMGVGGGFIMVPALIYLLRVPTNVVIGTSLFQITFTAAFTAVVQAATNATVDVVLALVLTLGGVVGAQYGSRVGQRLRGDHLRALLGALVLAVALRLAYALFVTPDDLYTLTPALT